MSAAYTSTVVSRGNLLVGGLMTALVLAGVVVGWAPWPVGLVAVVVIPGFAVWGGTVRLAAGPDGLRVAQGPYGRMRRIPLSGIRSAVAAEFTMWQMAGFFRPWRWRRTLLAVRPGPTLVVECHDGEVLYVSTPDPGAVARLLGHAGAANGGGPS